MPNNTKTFTFVGSIIAGMLGIIMVLYNTMYSPLSAEVLREAGLRKDGDIALATCIERIVDKQDKFLETLTEVKTDVRYLRMRYGAKDRNSS